MPWSMPQSSPVFGSQSKPMVLRSPAAMMLRRLPSGETRTMVAFSGLFSLQSLQVLPTLR